MILKTKSLHYFTSLVCGFISENGLSFDLTPIVKKKKDEDKSSSFLAFHLIHKFKHKA